MNFEDVKNAMDKDSGSGRLIAHVVISTYWQNKQMSLYSLMGLDTGYRKLAYEIIEYRLNPEWDDEQFHALALYARDVLDPPLLPHEYSLTPLKAIIFPKLRVKKAALETND